MVERDLPESVYERLRGERHFALPPAVLARLALSQAAAELSDAAAGLVRTDADSWARGGDLAEEADRLVAAARAVLAAAVVCERARGSSWTEVGEALAISKQAARERFRTDVARFDAGLDTPYVHGVGQMLNANLPDAALEPRRAGARLDQWVTDRHRPGQLDTGDRSVSAGTLDRDDHRDTRLATAVLAAGGRLMAAMRDQLGAPPVAERMLLERKVAAYEAMLLARPGHTDTLDLLAATRARIAEVRGRGDTDNPASSSNSDHGRTP